MEGTSLHRRLGLIVVILIATVLRWGDFPGRYERRDYDERPYVISGFALWEGITPTYKYSPAGPQIWISWAFAAVDSARYVIHPSAEERGVPLVLRPFVAGNHALFDLYRDWSTPRVVEAMASALVGVAAAAAGFGLGWKRGGWMPAALVGGLVAVLPVFVQTGDQARPFMMGWGFGIIALYYAAVAPDRPRAGRWSAFFMGLAIASRIDMLMLLPLAWADLIDLDTKPWPRVRRIFFFTFWTAVTALLVSPWILTNLIGNLRTIATVRLAEPTAGMQSSKLQMALDVAVFQGLGVSVALMMCGLFLAAGDRKRVRWASALFAILLVMSVLKDTGFGLKHQGGPIVALVTFAGVGMAGLARRWPKVALAALALALAPPAIDVIVNIVIDRRTFVADHTTEWVERHVPPGTRVYLSPEIHDPLPTVEASNALWAEVNDGDAWMRKMESGMQRFHVSTADYPRAFSEENMIIEKGLRREWFILGSRPFISDPRYDIRTFSESVVFGVKDVSAEFKRTGGVLICDDFQGIMPTDVGPPVAQWLDAYGKGIRIYVSPDVAGSLKDKENVAAW
jgi:hypothetical protein